MKHSGKIASRDAGFTLVELLIGIGMLAIVVALAVPSFTQIVARGRLKSSAEGFRTELAFARMEAVKRSRTVFVSLVIGGNGSWCYGTKLSSACDCTITDAANANYCFLDTAGSAPVRKVVSSTAYSGVTVGTNFSGSTISFSPTRPTLATGNATFAAGSQSLRVVASAMGRVRLCSPNASLAGYPSC